VVARLKRRLRIGGDPTSFPSGLSPVLRRVKIPGKPLALAGRPGHRSGAEQTLWGGEAA